jgi:hypothetical protein
MNMKMSFVMVLFLCPLFCLTGANELCAAYYISDYYPLQVGSTWSYTGGYSVVITGTEAVDGVTAFRVENWVNDLSSYGYGLLTNGPDGLRIYCGDGAMMDPPLTVIGASFEVGDEFTAGGAMVYQGSTVNTIKTTHTVLGFEELAVPAYSGESLKIGVSVDLAEGADYTEEIWLAKGIGLVKVINHNTVDEGYLWGHNNELIGYRTSPVPIPAAAWLFGPGLLGLFSIRKRRVLLG